VGEDGSGGALHVCGSNSTPTQIDFSKETPRLFWDNEQTGGGSFMLGTAWRDRLYHTAVQFDKL
jgi:hypothetical protein